MEDFTAQFKDTVNELKEEIYKNITNAYLIEVNKNRKEVENECKQYTKKIRDEMYKCMHIEGKVSPKISEEQAKVTGKTKYLGQFV